MLIRALLLSRHAEYAIGVDQKLHLNPMKTGWHWRNVLQVELRQTAAVFDEFAFTLENVDLDVRLSVNERREHLSSRRRNGRVARNSFRHHPTHCLDTKRQWRHVQQQHVASAPSKNIGLDSRAERDNFVRIQLGVWNPAKQFVNPPADERNSSGAADHHHFLNVCRI